MNTFVKVGDTKYKVKEHVTCGQFEQVTSWSLNDLRSRPFIAAILLGAELSAFKGIEEEDLQLIFNLSLISLSSMNDLSADDYQGPLDFSQMDFGTFIDLDTLSHEGLNQNLVQAISIIHACDVSDIYDEPMYLYWPTILAWQTFRMRVYERYTTFFGSNEMMHSEESDQSATEAKRVWYSACIALAGEDFMKVHQVVSRPLVEALNFLSWLKDRNVKKAEQQRHAARMAKMK